MNISDNNHFNAQIFAAFYQCRALPKFTISSRSCDGLIYYVKGGHRFSFDNCTIESSAGDFVYLPLGSKYKNQLLSPNTEYYEVDFIMYDNNIPKPLMSSPKKISTPDSFAHLSLLRSIADKFCQIHEKEYFSIFSDLCKAIAITVESVENNRTTPGIDRIIKSVAYIDRHYFENTPIEEIAAMSSTCISNFDRIFKRCFSVSPATYRNMLRIQHAKVALLSGYSIAETAAKVGFNDQFYFTKIFKQIAGITPGEYVKTYAPLDI